jgi:WD40 repeat protein
VSSPTVLAAHGRHAQAVAFTASGRLLLSAGQDARIRLWSVPGFKAVGSIIGHKKSVNSLAFSPDETLLATSSSDGTVRVWSFPDGRPDRVFDRQSAPRFSPSGKLLATLSTKGRITLWSMPDGAPVMETDPIDTRVFVSEFSPDEKMLLVGGTGAMHFVSVPDGRVEASVPAHDAAVVSLLRSPDNSSLVSIGPPGTVRVWSTANWASVATIALEGAGTYAAAFRPDSAAVSVSVDFHILTVSLLEQVVIDDLRVGVKGVYGLAYSPDGTWLANAAADGRVRVWARG